MFHFQILNSAESGGIRDDNDDLALQIGIKKWEGI